MTPEERAQAIRDELVRRGLQPGGQQREGSPDPGPFFSARPRGQSIRDALLGNETPEERANRLRGRAADERVRQGIEARVGQIPHVGPVPLPFMDAPLDPNQSMDPSDPNSTLRQSWADMARGFREMGGAAQGALAEEAAKPDIWTSDIGPFPAVRKAVVPAARLVGRGAEWVAENPVEAGTGALRFVYDATFGPFMNYDDKIAAAEEERLYRNEREKEARRNGVRGPILSGPSVQEQESLRGASGDAFWSALAPTFAGDAISLLNGMKGARPAAGALDEVFTPVAPRTQPEVVADAGPAATRARSLADEAYMEHQRVPRAERDESWAAKDIELAKAAWAAREAEAAAWGKGRALSDGTMSGGADAPRRFGHANTLEARRALDEATARNSENPFAPAPRYGENALQEPVPVRPQGPTDFARDMRFRSSDAADRGAIFPQAQQGALSDPFEPIGNAPGRREYAPQIFAGRKGAETLASTGEQRPLDAINLAEEMFARGASREEVYAATNQILEGTPYAGVSRTPDGQLRFEIDDKGATVSRFPHSPSNYELANQYARDNFGVRSVIDLPVGDIRRQEAMQYGHQKARTVEDLKSDRFDLDTILDHPELYRAYPTLRNTPTARNFDPRYYGTYLPSTNTIRVSEDAPILGQPYEMRSTVLHEVQHGGPQQIEGFARGGNPDTVYDEAITALNARMTALVREQDTLRSIINGGNTGVDVSPYLARLEQAKREYRAAMSEREALADPKARSEAYKRLSGEVEARNVQARENLPASGRRAIPPWETQDVPDADQIIRFDGGTSASVSPFEPMGNARGDDFSRPGNAPQTGGVGARADNDRGGVFSQMRGALTPEPRNLPRNPIATGVPPGRAANDRPLNPEIIEGTANPTPPRPPESLDVIQPQRTPYDNIDMPPAAGANPADRMAYIRNLVEKEFKGNEREAVAYLEYLRDVRSRSRMGDDFAEVTAADIEAIRSGAYKLPSSTVETVRPIPRDLPGNSGRGPNETGGIGTRLTPPAGLKAADAHSIMRQWMEERGMAVPQKGGGWEAFTDAVDGMHGPGTAQRIIDDMNAAPNGSASLHYPRAGDRNFSPQPLPGNSGRLAPDSPEGVFAPARPRQGEQNAGIGSETNGTPREQRGLINPGREKAANGSSAAALEDYADGLSWQEIARRNGHSGADSAKQNVNLLLRRARARIGDGHSIEKVAAENGTDAATLQRALDAGARPNFHVDEALDQRLRELRKSENVRETARIASEEFGRPVSIGMVQRAMQRGAIPKTGRWPNGAAPNPERAPRATGPKGAPVAQADKDAVISAVKDGGARTLAEIEDETGVPMRVAQGILANARINLRGGDPANVFAPIGIGATAGALALGAGDAEAASVSPDNIEGLPPGIDIRKGTWVRGERQDVTLGDGTDAFIRIWQDGQGNYFNILQQQDADGSIRTLGVVPSGGIQYDEATDTLGGYSAGNRDLEPGVRSAGRILYPPEDDGEDPFAAAAPFATVLGGVLGGRYLGRRFAPELRDMARIRASESLADMSAAPRPYDVALRPAASAVVRSTPEQFAGVSERVGGIAGGALGGASGAIATGQPENAPLFAAMGAVAPVAGEAMIRSGQEAVPMVRDGVSDIFRGVRDTIRDGREALRPKPATGSAAARRRALPDTEAPTAPARPAAPQPAPSQIFTAVNEVEDATMRTHAIESQGVPPVRGRKGIEERSEGGAATQLSGKTKGVQRVSNDDLEAIARSVGEEPVYTKRGALNRGATARKVASVIQERPKLGRVLREAFPHLPLAVVIGTAAGAGALSEDGPFAPVN